MGKWGWRRIGWIFVDSVGNINIFRLNEVNKSIENLDVAGPQRLWGPRMDTNEHESEFMDAGAENIIGTAYEVANALGAGFLEKVYERALVWELGLRGLGVDVQVHYRVIYKGHGVVVLRKNSVCR
jgi:hypothetical protein